MVSDIGHVETKFFTFGTEDDMHTRPILVIDGDSNTGYIFASSEFTTKRVIYMKSTDLYNPVFPPGLGTPFIESVADSSINNVTSTKQCLNGATGIVVLAMVPPQSMLGSAVSRPDRRIAPGRASVNSPRRTISTPFNSSP